MIKQIVIVIGLTLTSFQAEAQLKFTKLDSLLKYAEGNSVNIKIGSEQSLLSKWTKVAALGNIINLKSPISFSSTDNVKLPVNFIPAEVFGGPAGTFRQITLGQQYVSNFNINPQIDIINPGAWAKVKSASINKELTEVNNLMVKRSLFESIAAAYYNVVSLQEQIQITQQNLSAADSLVFIVQNKFSQGIVREQDLNNTKVNQLMVADKLAQLKLMLTQQYNGLKILCDISPSTSLQIEEQLVNGESGKSKVFSSLNSRYSDLQNSFAKSELRANRLGFLPTLSLVYYQGWQQNSNTTFFDNNATWIQSRYIGFRLSVPFPPDVNKMTTSYTSKINWNISKLNADHSKLQNDLNNESLSLDQDKATSSFETSKQITELKRSNYEKSLNQFKEGILSTDNLLTAFTDLLASRLNLASAISNLNFTQSKININNSIK